MCWGGGSRYNPGAWCPNPPFFVFSFAPSLIGRQDRLQKQQEYIRTMQDWYSFKAETKEYYGVDMTVLEVIFVCLVLVVYSWWNTMSEEQRGYKRG